MGHEVCDIEPSPSPEPEHSAGEHWIDMSSPFPSGFTRHYGGPGVGGHGGDVWQIAYGMDLGAAPGTALYAAFDGTISGWYMGRIDETGPPRYGAQVTVTSLDGKVAAFYTHFRNLPATLKMGARVNRGDYLGDISPTTGAPHLHLAIAELVGGSFQGVNLFQFFLDTANTSTVSSVTFFGDGRNPKAGQPRQPKEFADEHYEQRRHLAPKRVQRLQRQVGNRATVAALRSPELLGMLGALPERGPLERPQDEEHTTAAARER